MAKFLCFYWTYFNNYWSNFSKPPRTKLICKQLFFILWRARFAIIYDMLINSKRFLRRLEKINNVKINSKNIGINRIALTKEDKRG